MLTKTTPKAKWHRKNSSDIWRMAYAILREAGICVRCMNDWAHITETKAGGIKNHALCKDCLKYWRFRGDRKS
jgi:hypothetical protein